MIFVYPNYYGLPVLKEESYERSMRSAILSGDEEYDYDNINLFKQADDEYVEEELKNR